VLGSSCTERVQTSPALRRGAFFVQSSATLAAPVTTPGRFAFQRCPAPTQPWPPVRQTASPVGLMAGEAKAAQRAF
jgi:hypothetical protein